MPKCYEKFFQKLLGPYHQNTTMQYLAILIYFASNNLRFPTTDAAYSITRWLFLRDNLKVLRHLLSIKGPTTEALAEYLFGFAIEAKDTMVIKTLLHTGLDPNSYRTGMFWTPLQYALKTGNIELTRLLLDTGAEVESTTLTSFWNSKMTPLMLAVQAQKADLVNLLIATGASVNVGNSIGDSALHMAAQLRNIELVQILISAGADVNWMNWKQESVLNLAAAAGSVELIECILDAGLLDIGSAIVSAASQGGMGIVKILLNAGADIDYPSFEGLTAITMAIIEKDAELAEFLSKKGANVNGSASCYPSPNRCHYDDCPCGTEAWGFPPITPLQATSLRDMTELARILLVAGADVNTPLFCQHVYKSFSDFSFFSHPYGCEESGFPGTALQIAVYRENKELAEILVEAGADVNAPASGCNGRTALQAAVEKGDIYLIECLLDVGAEINDLPSEYTGLTVLNAAVERGDFKLINFLLNAGANINHPSARSSGRTALQAAVSNSNDINLIYYLLDNGADSDDPGALYSAVVCGKYELIPILLAARGKADGLKSKLCGYNALQAAIETEKLQIVQALLAAGIDVNLSTYS